MLEARGLCVAIGGTTLVSDVSLAISAGELLVIIGPNGAGKSTLLRAFSGEQRPSDGEVLLDGTDIRSLTAAELAARRAVMPQASQLQFPFTVEEVVGLGVAVPGFGVAAAGARQLVASALQRADVAHLATRLYPTLSGGERQRVHLARALCQLTAAPQGLTGTRVLLLDEPTSSLDLAHQLLILEAAREEARRGTAVAVVLHDFNLAARYADRIALMSTGRLATIGSPHDVLTDSMLSSVLGCRIRAGHIPRDGVPFVLPQACEI